MKIIERNLQEIGKSLLVSLPKEWTKRLRLKKGSKIKMIVSDKGNLRIAPEFTKKQVKKQSIIKYDENFERKFFREYFEGNEKIIIEIGSSDKNNKEIYRFLKRFMDVQIIEETKNKVIVKCFKINELSIEECLKRMHFLSLNLLDEVLEFKNQTKIKEIRDTMTRFYYLLVMQIRRYLSEGKYTLENQIPLIYAMDIRMVAEKIQRIGQIIINLNMISKEKDKIVSLIKEIDDYYSRAFRYFINRDFEKALPLWKSGKKLRNKAEKLKQKYKRNKDIKSYKNITDLLKIVRYSKEISMLVR
jgi:phosphate uptake regulator